MLKKLRGLHSCTNHSEKLADSLATGEGEKLLRLAQLNLDVHENHLDNSSDSNEVIDNLKKIYDQYVNQKLPFVEQIRLLSLLPRSWTYDETITRFKCSRHAVKTAHQMRHDQDYYLNREETPSIRQRIDPERIRHFITWLVESNMLVSGIIYHFIYISPC